VLILEVMLLFTAIRPTTFSLPSAYFELLHNADWTPAHTKLSAVLTLAITIDIMKPATIGFIMPGLLAEYGLTKTQGAVLPTVAISGTVIGSVIWGFMADRVGRKYSILLSTILFIATSICGAMPSFPTNVFMCWLMGVSVGMHLRFFITFQLTAHLMSQCL
jgi:MFS transporter, putative metabolite:H+ symporter